MATKRGMRTDLSTCDGCGKQRRDVQSVGRDSNGDPDAPDMCFLCRVEWTRGRVYSREFLRYISLVEYAVRAQERAGY